jgi:Short C-terminal domain
MRQLSSAGHDLVNGIAQRHGFSLDATMSMLESMINGNGSMAQFNHPEFAGSGQWMRGGMTMVSDMFNNQLKGRVDALCSELSNLVANQPDLVRSGSFQSQSQGGGYPDSSQHQSNYGAGGQQQGGGSFGAASLFVPGSSNDWWPSDLRFPNSTGAQNGVRYAHFAQAHRLVIDLGGTVTVYDTLDHQIGGFSQQQQSAGGTLGFNSQYGLIDVASLPVISSNGQPPRPVVPAQSTAQGGAWSSPSTAPAGNEQDVLATIDKLAGLHAKGILSEVEFQSKKADLLARL